MMRMHRATRVLRTRRRGSSWPLVVETDEGRYHPGVVVWELRVGDYRVFYDVDRESRRVIVRAIRHKGRKTTEEIL